MLLFHKPTNALVEVITLSDLFNPGSAEIVAADQCGQEAQDPDTFLKSEMIFPSGEPLPLCWTDSHYRVTQAQKDAPKQELISI